MILRHRRTSRVCMVLLLLGAVAEGASFSRAGDVPKAKLPSKDKAPVIEAAIENGVPAFLAGRASVVRAGGPDGKVTGLFQMGRDNRNVPIVMQATGAAGEGIAANYAGMGWTAADKITRVGPRLFRCERTWTNRTGKEQEAVLVFELRRTTPVDFYMIPAISYNGNHRWPRAGFQGLKASSMSPQEVAESISGAQYVVAGDRMMAPACTITEGAGVVAGLYAEPKDASYSACSLDETPAGMVQRLWWPHQEQPFGITGSGRSVQAPWETVFFRPGDSVRRAFYIALGAAPSPRMGYATVLDDAWALFYHKTPPRRSPKELWDLGMRFAKESLWIDSPEFTGFSFSLEPRDGGFYITTWPWRYEIGFVGQAGALGAFMVQDYLFTKNEDSWKKAELSLDFWAKNGRLPNGLIYPRFDDKQNLNADPDVDTRNMGDAAYFYLLASELAEKAGRPKPLWKETGLGICDFFRAHILPNGRFGKKWKADGRLVNPDGTLGCYLLQGLIKAWRMSGDGGYLDTAKRAFRAYADDDLEAVCLTAGAIDADTIDKETGLPMLLAALDLYEITKEPYYLEKAVKAGHYLSTWQYAYSIDFPKDSPAATMDYDSFGGTTVGVGGGGADQGGANITLGWLRLWKATGDEIWKQRALAAWGHTTIGVSDGTLKLNGKILPAGGQNEGYQHTRTRDSYTSRQGHGNEWLCAWCTAFRLWTLQHWADWGVLE